MGSPPSIVHRTVPVAMAFLLVATGLLMVAETGTAQAGGNAICVQPAQFATLSMAPNGSEVSSKQANSARTILVKNNDQTESVTVVEFKFVLLDRDATDYKYQVHFVFGEKPGWDVRWQNVLDDPQNTEDGYTITFRSLDPAKFALRPGEEQAFTIYVNIIGNPSLGYVLPLRVTGTYADGTAAQTPYDYCMQVDRSAPQAIYAMGFDRTGLPPFEDWPNGHIDQVEIAWNETLDPGSFRIQDFKFHPPGEETNPYVILNYEFLADQTTNEVRPVVVEELDQGPTPEPAIPLSSATRQCLVDGELVPRCTRIRFYLEEKGGFDTGIMPDWRYTPGTLKDLAGNLMRNKGATAEPQILDLARPVIVGAIATHNGYDIEAQGEETYEEVLVTFSERVVSTDSTQQDACGAGQIHHGQLRWIDGPASYDDPTTAAVETYPTGNTAQGPDAPGLGFNFDNPQFGKVFHPFNPAGYVRDSTDPCGSHSAQAIPNYNQVLFRTRQPSLVDPRDLPSLVDGSVPGDPSKWFVGDVPRNPSYNVGDKVCYRGGFDDRFRGNPSAKILAPDGVDDDPNEDEIGFKIREFEDPATGAGAFRLQAIGLDNTRSADAQYNVGEVFPACKRVHLPDTIMALVNIDSNRAIVQFTGPMSDRASDKSSIRPEDIDVVPTTVDQGCPHGELAVNHVPGSDIAFVTMDDVACPTDVDDTPSYIRVAPARIRGTGTVMRIPGSHEDCKAPVPPDKCNGKPVPPSYPPIGEDGMNFVRTRDIEMYDLIPPKIVHAHTVDQDGNGAIDGVFVQMSERIDDGTFCADNLVQCKGPYQGGMIQVLMRPEAVHPDLCMDDIPNVPQDSLTCVTLSATSGIEPISCWTTQAGSAPAFYWETDTFGNDKFGIIKWRVSNPYGGGDECVAPSPAYDPVTVRSRVARGLATMHDTCPQLSCPGDDLPQVPHQTGLIPDFVTTPVVGINLFKDQAIRHVLPPQGQNSLRLNNRNGMDPVASHDIHEMDGAPPVILLAESKDFLPFGNSPKVGTVGCRITLPDNPSPPPCRDNGNGYLDTYRLELSEKVSDASFSSVNWTVGGKPVSRLTTGNGELDFANDHVVHVEFPERSDIPDTGDLPQLIHERTLADPPKPTSPRPVSVRDQRLTDPGFRDLHNVPMNDVLSTTALEIDGARPVLMQVQGKPNENTLLVTFSEPVDDGVSGPVIRADLTYLNRFNPKAVGGVTPPSVSGFSGDVEVVHRAGDREVLITLNGPLHADDIKQDQIAARYDPANGPYDPLCPYEQDQVAEAVCAPQCPQMFNPNTNACISARYLGPTGYVFESQPNLAKELRQPALNYPRGLAESPDTIPPQGVTDLFLDRITSNSVRLTWTAPGDDGAVGTVKNYTIKVSTTPILKEDGTDVFDSVNNPDEVDFDPDVTLPDGSLPGGSSQSVTVVGLRPRTSYYFAIKATDEKPNTSAISNQQSAETLQDTTPPTGTLSITSSTHAAGLASLSEQARFEWTELKDLESTVEYHFRLTDKRDYSVVLGDAKTTLTNANAELPEEGEWWFHVRGYSGAGPQPTTAHFGPIIFGYPEIDIGEIEEANLLMAETTWANETANGVEIEWVIPEETLPGDLEAVEIWRLDDGAWVRIHREPGLLNTLRVGNFTDQQGTKDDKYLVTLAFKDDQKVDNPRPSSSPGVKVKALQDRTVPSWVFILLGVCLALILAGLIIFFVLRRRSRQELEATAIPYAWENAAGPQTGIDQATGLPMHDVTCPNCSTLFQAVGEFPLAVTCPSCGASGTLD